MQYVVYKMSVRNIRYLLDQGNRLRFLESERYYAIRIFKKYLPIQSKSEITYQSESVRDF